MGAHLKQVASLSIKGQDLILTVMMVSCTYTHKPLGSHLLMAGGTRLNIITYMLWTAILVSPEDTIFYSKLILKIQTP